MLGHFFLRRSLLRYGDHHESYDCVGGDEQYGETEELHEHSGEHQCGGGCHQDYKHRCYNGNPVLHSPAFEFDAPPGAECLHPSRAAIEQHGDNNGKEDQARILLDQVRHEFTSVALRLIGVNCIFAIEAMMDPAPIGRR